MGQIVSQVIYTPDIPRKRYADQTIVLTGSNTGLGLEAARWVVRLGAKKVILAVRSLDKGAAAKASIESSEKRPGVVEVRHLDLTSYASVKENATRLSHELERIDILIENAGIMTSKFRKFEDNESTITTNVVSPLLHGLLLLPKLRETSKRFNTTPKMVFTTSFVHSMTIFPEQKEQHIFEALADEKKADMEQRQVVPIQSVERHRINGTHFTIDTIFPSYSRCMPSVNSATLRPLLRKGRTS